METSNKGEILDEAVCGYAHDGGFFVYAQASTRTGVYGNILCVLAYLHINI